MRPGTIGLALGIPYIDRMMAIKDPQGATLADVPLKVVSWPAFPYLPKVRLGIGYDNSGFLLYWQVSEYGFRAVHRAHNEAVYEDSCVEFFVSFDQVRYYNIEFNALGYGLIGFGDHQKGNRVNLPPSVVDRIALKSSGIKHAGDISHWDLLMHIPFQVFVYDVVQPVKGQAIRANFYKCGDKCTEPHFVSWKKIGFPTPNFHLPEFFGPLVFG